MKRDIATLVSATWDVCVIGGGIMGAAIAYDASMRGLRVALVEKGDFGGETSQGCFKIVHGGLRYLQHADLSRLFQSVEEQRILRFIAPHLVHPLPIVVPCYGRGMKGRGVLRFGMTLYEALTSTKNRDVDAYHRLPHHRVIDREQCLAIAPGLKPEGLTGGVVFFDCQMSSSERLTLAFIKSAVREGAQVCNYATAVKFNTRVGQRADSRSIVSVVVEDGLANKQIDLSARVVINATGPFSHAVELLCDSISPVERERAVAQLKFSKGFQVVLPQFIKGYTVAVESREADRDAVVSRGSRNYFIMPWRGHSLVGTTDDIVTGDPSQYAVTRSEVVEFLTQLRNSYNSDMLSVDRVKLVFGGLRPVMQSRAKRAGGPSEYVVSRDDKITDHSRISVGMSFVENLVSVSGVKYTTARAVAEEVVDLACRKLERSRPGQSSRHKLCGGEIIDFTTFLANQFERNKLQFPDPLSRHLASHYGTEVEKIYRLVSEDSTLGDRIVPHLDIIGAEIVHTTREEMVGRLSDVVFRRTGLGTLGYPGVLAINKVAQLAARELGWDEARKLKEIEDVNEIFRESLVGLLDVY